VLSTTVHLERSPTRRNNKITSIQEYTLLGNTVFLQSYHLHIEHYVVLVEDGINLTHDELLVPHAGPIRKDIASSILPQKIYSVIGLEASGTQFIASLIRDSLNLQYCK
jgi:hypothetical protein